MEAWSRGLATTAVVVVIALVVALMAVWVWPSAPSGAGGAQPEPAVLDVAGPVGRIGTISTGPNTGGATDDPLELEQPGARVGIYSGRAGTESISAPIGGFEPARGVGSEAGGVVATPRAAGGAGRATPTATRSR